LRRTTEAWVLHARVGYESSSGGAKESSPRRKPSGNRAISTSPGTGRKIAALFRPVPGLGRKDRDPHGSRRGLLSFALWASRRHLTYR
jgi:hypothetical protein